MMTPEATVFTLLKRSQYRNRKGRAAVRRLRRLFQDAAVWLVDLLSRGGPDE